MSQDLADKHQLGGATGQIGDPTGLSTSREQINKSVRKINIVKLHYQLKKLWLHVETHARKYGYMWEWAWRRELCNNNIWLNKLSILELLKLVGMGFRVGDLLERET